METLEQTEERYKIGQPIFEELWKLNDKELKEKLKSILQFNPHAIELLNYSCDCCRIIKNEKPDVVSFNFYDTLELSWMGIEWIGEHGKRDWLRRFDQHFKL